MRKRVGKAEMRMLRWMCGHTRKDIIRNDYIQGKIGVTPIEGPKWTLEEIIKGSLAK